MANPIDTVREGNVSVSVWENPRTNGTTKQTFMVLSASMQKRVYDEKEQTYKNYNSFSIPELKKLITCLEKVYAKYTSPEVKSAENIEKNFTQGWKELKQ